MTPKPEKLSKLESAYLWMWYRFRFSMAMLIIGMLIGAGCAFTMKRNGLPQW